MSIREAAERLADKCYQAHPVTEFQRDINDGVLVAGSWLKVDGILGEMSKRGETSPELRIYRTVGGTGMTMWQADWGAWRGWSVTPWGAIEDLGRKLKEAGEKQCQE